MNDIKIIIISNIVMMVLITISAGMIETVKDKSNKNIFAIITYILVVVYVIGFWGVLIPYICLSSVFGSNNIGFIAIILLGIIVGTWILVYIVINKINSYIINKNQGEEIYIRDVDVDYSPAVLSYLMNNKIEQNKDLSATLLNLCAKNILKIEKTEDNKIKIIDLKNKQEVEKLKEDERFAYRMFYSRTFNTGMWARKVEKEYQKYKFSKKNNSVLFNYIFILYAIVFIVLWFYGVLTGSATSAGEEIFGTVEIITIAFFATWEAALIYGMRELYKYVNCKDDEPDFKGIYTKKGAKEYSKWKKFEKFMESYSLINDKNYDSVAIWGKYLAYSIVLGINKKCDKELYKQIVKEYSFDYDSFGDRLRDLL